MSNFPQKRNVNVAAVSGRKHDLSHQHIGTMEFGRYKPIECRYMVPGDQFNYDIYADIRALSSLPSPTYGQFKVKFRAFFIPLHKLYKNFYNFLSNQISAIDGEFVDSEIGYCYLGDIRYIFMDISSTGPKFVEVVQNPTSETEYDILGRNDDEVTYYRLTRKGRRVYDLLSSLGLTLPFKDWNYANDDLKLNIYPLIAFWKAYIDWIVPARFIHYFGNIYEFLSKYEDGGYIDGNDVLKYLLTNLPYSYYEDDIYTTSTYLPFSDQENMQDEILINNPSTTLTDTAAYGVLDVEQNTSGAFATAYDGNIFNSFTLQTLGKLQDYLNRGLIAGNKVQNWLLSEFGLRPSDDALGLSTYLGKKEFDLDIKSVVATADTEATGGVPLGSYGGYVNNKANVKFEYDAKEHGYMIITCELVPRTSYVSALNPEWTMIDRFDFFQPEFDNQQGAPISYGMIDFDKSFNNDRVFGFNLQYAPLKQANDIMSGDFKNRFGLELKSWFLYRDIQNVYRISESFCRMNPDSAKAWNYIFADTGDDVDHWLTYFYIQNHAIRPMKSITEGFEPEYQQSGKNVTMSFNGSVN